MTDTILVVDDEQSTDVAEEGPGRRRELNCRHEGEGVFYFADKVCCGITRKARFFLGYGLMIPLFVGCAESRQASGIKPKIDEYAASRNEIGSLQTWSSEVNGLRGRLVVAQPWIGTHDWLQVTLELENVGKMPMVVQLQNPLLFRAEVEHDFGHGITRLGIPPTIDRSGELMEHVLQANNATEYRGFPIPGVDCSCGMCFPKYIVIEIGKVLRIPLTIEDANYDKGGQVNTTTEIWKLPPGRYLFGGLFHSMDDVEPKVNLAAELWSGQLVLFFVPFAIASHLKGTP